MVIKEVVKGVPKGFVRKEAYREVVEKVGSLGPGEWLSVECGDKKELGLVCQALRRVGLKVRQAGLVLYMRRGEAE